MSVAHKWSPIAETATLLSDGELPALLEVWQDQKKALSAAGAIAKFSEQLNREWAIETGIIERVYSIDRGTTQTLIEMGIEKGIEDLRRHAEGAGRTPEEIAAILHDHLDALEGMFALITGERELTVGYIKELHGVLFRHIEKYKARDQFERDIELPLVRGAYKTLPNSPSRTDGTIHEYCPPEHVGSEMERLVDIHRKQAQANLPPEVQAAWLHHAFTQIHPFADGNGRVARTLASLVFVKGGGFPLVIRRDDDAPRVRDNTQYIRALEQADEGDLRPLISLFVRAERRVLFGALQALPQPGAQAKEKEAPLTPEEAITEIRDMLVSRGEVLPKGWEVTSSFSTSLLAQVTTRLDEIVEKSRAELTSVKPEFRFSHHSTLTDVVTTSARAVAQRLGYDLTFLEKPQTKVLDFRPGTSQLIFACGRIGSAYRGIQGAVLAFVGPDGTAVPATDDIFQLNYKDGPAPLQIRFRKWLDAGLTRALEMWRAQI